MSDLIFFDINGTIVKRDERTDLPYIEAANELLYTDNAMKDINNAARSDMDVFREILMNHTIEYTEALWTNFLEIYERKLEEYKSTDIWRINKDAKKFIEKLAKTDHKLALITGELEIGARFKLEKVGVWQHFPLGGFGEDNVSRFGIADVALQKAKKYYNESFDNIYVIGDTTLDIATARHIDAKIISIATGANTKKELEYYKPDYLITRFRKIKKLFL